MAEKLITKKEYLEQCAKEREEKKKDAFQPSK
jgi:hypothetical protein